MIEATTTSYPGALKKVEITGSGGSVVLEEEDLIQWQFAEEQPLDQQVRDEMQGQPTTGGGAADPSAIGHHGHQMFFDDFANAVATGGQPLIDGRQGRISVEVIEAIYRSAREGCGVDLL